MDNFVAESCLVVHYQVGEFKGLKLCEALVGVVNKVFGFNYMSNSILLDLVD